MQAEFDQTNPKDIDRYGKRLVGGSLRTVSGMRPLSEADLSEVQGGKTRGRFGMILQENYFGISPGNESAPDFSAAGVELKSFPLKKRSKGGHQAKERLVLNIINYQNEAEKTFETSSFMSKNEKMELIGYLHEASVNVVDFRIKLATLFDFKTIPEDEQRMIRADWEKIHKKIREGRAHELSEGDTLLLGACTKAATSKNTRGQANGGPPAKPRAFSFKMGYITRIARRELGEPLLDVDEERVIKGADVKKADAFEALVVERFQPFIGKTISEIHAAVGAGLNPGSKGYLADLSRAMMGIRKKKVAEFESAEISMKTIQLKANGMPKEHMSFPAFDPLELVQERWDGDEEAGEKRAAFQKQIEKRFFFVVFQCDGDCKGDDTKRLKKVAFWTMPAGDLKEAQAVWEETQRRVASGILDLPGATENAVAHVRPHAQNAADWNELPNGDFTVKKGFWLNAAYIKGQIGQFI